VTGPALVTTPLHASASVGDFGGYEPKIQKAYALPVHKTAGGRKVRVFELVGCSDQCPHPPTPFFYSRLDSLEMTFA
jgi:hypothetical protein